MTVQERINQSIENLGGGNYKQLAPVITEAGQACGWYYSRTTGISAQNKNFQEFRHTLDNLLTAGMIKLEWQVRCQF